MIHVPPRRLATMLDNALVAAKEGNKPYPLVGLWAHRTNLYCKGIGQHVMVVDCEGVDGPGGPPQWCVIHSDEAEDAAKAVRQVPGAARKDTTVFVSLDGGTLRVVAGDDTIVSLPCVDDDEWDAFVAELAMAEDLEPREPKREIAVFSNQILATLGKLKPNGDAADRIVVLPHYAGDTARFETGSVWGYIEGNRTDPSTLI